MKHQKMQNPVKVIVYVRGGMCQEVKTNLPDDSWEYGLVDYDNDPDLPDDYLPFNKAEMAPLPSSPAGFDLIRSAQAVIANWEKGDLAAAVRKLAEALATIHPW